VELPTQIVPAAPALLDSQPVTAIVKSVEELNVQPVAHATAANAGQVIQSISIPSQPGRLVTPKPSKPAVDGAGAVLPEVLPSSDEFANA
jgi:hypothetical protein